MKLKKFAAVFMVATLTTAPLTAFAADVTDPANATGTASGAGSIEGYVKEEAFSVVLPTVAANALDFKLDPQALLAISDNTNYGSETAGSVVFTATKKASSDVVFATNHSSYPVLLSVDVKMTNDVTNPVKIITDKSKINDDTNLNVYFAAVPEQKPAAVSTYTTSTPSTKVALPVDGTSLESKFAYSIAGTTDNYKIKYDDSTKIYSYAAIDAPKWDSVGFTLTGLCNKNADWSTFNTGKGALKCDLTWDIKKADTTTPYTVDGTPVADDAYGLVATTPAKVAPSVSTTTATFTKATPSDVTINYSLGSATKVSEVYVKGNSGTETNYKMMTDWAKYVTVTDSSITISKDWLQYYTGNIEVFVSYDGAAQGATADCTITVK